MHQFTFPPAVYEGRFSFPHTLANTCYLLSFYGGHSDRYELISHCGFNFHFPNNYCCLLGSASGKEPTCQLRRCKSFHVCLLWRNIYSATLHIFLMGLFTFLLLGCMSSLYILDINSLSDISFENMFSQGFLIYRSEWVPT